MVYDAKRQSTLLYGGCIDAGCLNADGLELWEWNGSVWNEIPSSPASSPAPAPSLDALMVYDPNGGRATFAALDDFDVQWTTDLYTYEVIGDACTSSATCDTGVCEDGVCCQAACASPCDTCNPPANPGVCASRTACVTSCDGDHTLVTSDGQGTVDCSPFGCEPGGKCKTTCTSPVDCAAPNVCDPSSSTCVAPKASASGGSSGCVVVHGDDEGVPVWLAAALVAAAVAVAKRRRGR